MFISGPPRQESVLMNLRSIKGLRTQRRFRNRSNLRLPRLERLENRTMLAGDVSAVLRGQDAIVRGDAADNSIAVAVENGNVVVRGLDGTTVNGSAETFVLIAGSASIPRDLRILPGNGNDTVNVDGVTIGDDLIVNGGNGNDQIGVSNSSVVMDSVVIDGWRGNDTISLQDSTVGRNAVLRGSRGADTLVVSTATIGRHLVVSGGHGDDDIVVDNSTVSRDARLVGWGGNDDIVVRNSTVSDDLAVVGHSGDDIIMIDTSTVADRAHISGRTGNDNIVVQGASRFQGRSRILGGAGADNLERASEATFARLRQRSFSGTTANAAAVATRITDATTGAIAAAEAAVTAFDPQITLSVSTSTIAEGAGTGAATLTVTRPSPADTALEVNLTSSDTSRLTLQQTTATIASGATSAEVLLDPQDNSTVDGNAVITITATTADSRTATIDVTVTDDDTAASATLTALENQVTEDTGGIGNPGTANTLGFRLEVGAATNEARTFALNYSLDDGSAADLFVTGPSEVVVPANETVAQYEVTTVANTTVEADQVIRVTASSGGQTAAETTFSVIDNDSPRLTVNADASSVTEGGPPASITVTRNTDTTQALAVTLTSNNSGRLNFDGNDTLVVQIPAGSNSITQPLTTVDDTTDNGDVTATITATATGLTAGTDSLSVLDNDDPALSIVLPNTNIVSENAGTDAITATIGRNSGDLSSALTVALDATGDMRLSVPATISIPAGQSSVDVMFDTVDNNTVDTPADGTATVTVSSGGFTGASADITITDDDSATFSLAPNPITVDEAAGTATLSLTRNQSVGTQTVSLSYSDETLVTGPSSVTFNDGDNIRSVQLTIIDNALFSENSDVTVTATSPSNANVTTTIVVTNNDTLSLTTDFTANSVVESVEAMITKDENFTITGTTSPGATVEVETNGNAAFDEGSTVADPDGNYSVTVSLAHNDSNDGLNRVQVRSRLESESLITTSDITNVHLAVGTVIRFETNQDLDSDGISDFYDVELLDTDAPVTVTNFLSYVNDGSYDNMIIHRSPPNFVIQGGGFSVENGVVTRIPTRPAITGEFSAANSNVRGTLSMAHTGDPNTGTSQWFFNVVNNVPSLDNAQHTVFGEVIGGGMTVVDTINTISTADLSLVTGHSALGETPVTNSPFTPLGGNVSLTANSNILIGSGTQFTTQLQVGSILDIAGSQVAVTAITSDTELTIDVEANGNQTGLPLSLVSAPPDQDYVVFTNIGEILDGI